MDNLPNSCLESMAHGRVVLGTYGTSFDQLIDSGVSGLLCNPDDPKSLLKIANEVIQMTDERRHDIGMKALDRIKRMNPSVSISQSYVSFYRDIIKRNPVNRHSIDVWVQLCTLYTTNGELLAP